VSGAWPCADSRISATMSSPRRTGEVAQQRGGAVGVVQPVVDEAPGALADEEAVVPVRGVGAHHHRYLVVVRWALLVVDVNEQQAQRLAETRVAADANPPRSAAPPGEPALARQPVGQQAGQFGMVVTHSRPPDASARRSSCLPNVE